MTLTFPCLLCNAPLPVDSEALKQMKKPAAICRGCFGKMNSTQIELIYLLRTQIGELRKELDEMKTYVGQLREYVAKNVQQLYEGQGRLEQDLNNLNQETTE